MNSVLVGFSTIWLVIGTGWLMARLRLLDESAQKPMAYLSFFVGNPALMFSMMVRADVAQLFSRHLVASVLAMAVAAATYLVVDRMAFRRGAGDATIATWGASYTNAANVGIPMATFLLGDATWPIPILLVQTLVMQPIGLAILDERAARAAHGHVSVRKRLLMPFQNPMTVSVLIGTVFNIAGIRLPQFLMSPIDLMGQMNIPLMLVAFGVSLWTGGFPRGARHLPQMWSIVAVKLLFMPLVAYVAARFVFGFDAHTVYAVTLLAGLPSAQNTFVNATRYEQSVPLARDVVFSTTVLSIPSMLLIALLAHA